MTETLEHPATPRTDEPSDEAIFRLFHESRDEAIFARLVQRNERFAYRISFGYCGKPELAEEIAQEAFIKIVSESSPDALKGYPSFKIWFSGVVMNVARRVVRSELRIIRRERKKQAMAHSAQEQISGAASSLDGETRNALVKALGELTEELRLTVVLHFIEGMSQNEIGVLFGISQGTVSKRIQKGLDSLRTQLVRMGMAVSALALPQLLQSADLLRVPASFHAAYPSLVARALSQGGRATHAAPKGYSVYVLLAISTAVIIATGIWINTSRYANVTPTASPEYQVSQTQTLPLTWTFEKPEDAQNLKVLAGSWSWVPPAGKMPAGMRVVGSVFVTIDAVAPKLPYKATFRCNARGTKRLSFGFYYLSGSKKIEHVSWSKERLFDSQWLDMVYYCNEPWILATLGGKVIYLSKYDRAYPTDAMGFTLQDMVVNSIRIEQMPSDECERLMGNPESLIAQHELSRKDR